MGRIPGVRRFLRLSSGTDSLRQEVADELAFHIESRVEALMALGFSAASARAQALREFGDVPDAQQELVAIDRVSERRRRRGEWRSALWQDTRHSVRGLLREPVFTLGVVLTLGLGLGLNGAMFGVTDRLLFQPPAHIVSADQVTRVYYAHTPSWSGAQVERAGSYLDYAALTRLKSFQAVGAYFSLDASLGRGQEARKVRWTMATASLFRTLQVKPHIGRFFQDAEDQPGNPQRVIVLGYSFWQRHFGGQASVLGSTLEVGKQSYTVIGVAPRGFSGADLERIDLFVPMSAVAREATGDDWASDDGWRWLRVVGRLRDGVSASQAAAEATAVIKARRGEGWSRDPTAHVTMESMVLGRAPGDTANRLPDTARIALWLSGVSLLVLLIACANVINLLLARVIRRRREVGIRMALGVSRLRLMRHFLIETTVLALTGGAVGLLLARWGGALIRTFLLPDIDWSNGAISTRVLWYTLLLVAVCALVAAVAPALQSLNTNLVTVLKSGARAGTRSRTRNALVVLQTTLSVLLLAGAGLFVRSLLNVNRMDKGFTSSRVVALSWDANVLDLSAAEWDRMYHQAAQRVRQLPQVENAAVAMTVPFWSSIATELRAQDVDSLPRVRDGGPFYNGVTPEYFATVGTRIIRGRVFTADDGKPGRAAAIVSETMASKLWPGQNPLGKCLYVGPPQENPPCSQVVGVAQNALRYSLEREVMQYYVPLVQLQPLRLRALFVRTRTDPYSALTQIRQVVQQLHPRLPFADTKVLAELVAPHTRAWRLGATLFTAFGALALLLAAIGLYSLIAYNVTQRSQEMSLRLALGARASHVFGLVLGDASRLVVAGSLLGIIGAFSLAGLAEPLLFQVSARDPLVVAGAAALLLVTGLLATLLPARRALRTDPLRALVNE